MAKNPSYYGLKNLKKAKRSVFDREYYLFDEINGPGGKDILKRNEKHIKLLQSCLEKINSLIPKKLQQIL